MHTPMASSAHCAQDTETSVSINGSLDVCCGGSTVWRVFIRTDSEAADNLRTAIAGHLPPAALPVEFTWTTEPTITSKANGAREPESQVAGRAESRATEAGTQADCARLPVPMATCRCHSAGGPAG